MHQQQSKETGNLKTKEITDKQAGQTVTFVAMPELNNKNELPECKIEPISTKISPTLKKMIEASENAEKSINEENWKINKALKPENKTTS